MALREINFDGIIGPTHNYAGLSPGNLASANNAGAVSRPRDAALQGIAKMQANLDLGLAQGFFVPLPRPDHQWLQSLNTDYTSAEPHIRAAALSASSMWAANAATVSPAPDSDDGRCHLTVANLVTMAHRSHEWPDTLAQLRLAFADTRHFAVHGPVPAPYGDEGAANHMRLCPAHGEAGVEIFVYGRSGGAFPARQHIEASRAVARRHALDIEKTLFIEQSPEAIAAGAFHNDVVAVANEQVLFTHEQAFADRDGALAAIHAHCPWAQIVEVPAASVSLEDAIRSYLFNAQLVTLPDGAAHNARPGEGGQKGQNMALILPTEAQEIPAVWNWLEAMVAGHGPIRRLIPVDVRQSMANGGGPACLRLRVVADPQTIDPRFIATPEKLSAIAAVVEQHWPQEIASGAIGSSELIAQTSEARALLLKTLQLDPLIAPAAG